MHAHLRTLEILGTLHILRKRGRRANDSFTGSVKDIKSFLTGI